MTNKQRYLQKETQRIDFRLDFNFCTNHLRDQFEIFA